MTVEDAEPALLGPQRVLICLLGDFRVLKAGCEVPMRSAGKTAMLLTLLALGEGHRVSRQVLLGALWPDSEEARGSHGDCSGGCRNPDVAAGEFGEDVEGAAAVLCGSR